MTLYVVVTKWLVRVPIFLFLAFFCFQQVRGFESAAGCGTEPLQVAVNFAKHTRRPLIVANTPLAGRVSIMSVMRNWETADREIEKFSQLRDLTKVAYPAALPARINRSLHIGPNKKEITGA